jgi:hypothetical protein
LASPWKVVKVLSLELWVTSLSRATTVPARAPVRLKVFFNVVMVLPSAVRDDPTGVLLTRVTVPWPTVGFVA